MGMKEQVDAAVAGAEKPSNYSEERLTEIAAAMVSIRLWVQIMGWSLIVGLLLTVIAVFASR